MRKHTVRISACVLTVALRLTAAVPALANMPYPGEYPEAAERYQHGMERLFWGAVGGTALGVVVVVLGAVLLIRWIIRRNSATATDTAEPVPPETP